MTYRTLMVADKRSVGSGQIIAKIQIDRKMHHAFQFRYYFSNFQFGLIDMSYIGSVLKKFVFLLKITPKV